MSTTISSSQYFIKKSIEYAEEINLINNGLSVAGLYLNSILLKSFKSKLRAAETVFGLKDNSKFPIGELFDTGCLEAFSIPESEDYLDYIRRLDFLACPIHILPFVSDPEKRADLVVQKCVEIQETANSFHINATIRCIYEYTYTDPVINRAANVKDVGMFQKFWCKLVHTVVGKQYPKFIMRSAFDFNGYFDELWAIRKIPQYNSHSGWWRRTHSLSYDEGAFVEKVEEFHGGNAFPNCSKLCDVCKNTQDCCLGTCHFDADTNLRGYKADRLICRKADTLCDDPPVTTAPENISTKIWNNTVFKLSPDAPQSYLNSAILISCGIVGAFIFVSTILCVVYRVRFKFLLNMLKLFGSQI